MNCLQLAKVITCLNFLAKLKIYCFSCGRGGKLCKEVVLLVGFDILVAASLKIRTLSFLLDNLFGFFFCVFFNVKPTQCDDLGTVIVDYITYPQ